MDIKNSDKLKEGTWVYSTAQNFLAIEKHSIGVIVEMLSSEFEIMFFDFKCKIWFIQTLDIDTDQLKEIELLEGTEVVLEPEGPSGQVREDFLDYVFIVAEHQKGLPKEYNEFTPIHMHKKNDIGSNLYHTNIDVVRINTGEKKTTHSTMRINELDGRPTDDTAWDKGLSYL